MYTFSREGFSVEQAATRTSDPMKGKTELVVPSSQEEHPAVYDRAYYNRLFDQLAHDASKYIKGSDLVKLREAFEYSYAAHEGQYRKSGLPYFDHIIEVVKILVEQNMDGTTLMAAFLHDVIEDTGHSYEDIEARFGADVADLVDGVTKISGFEAASLEIKQAENYRKMLLSMAKDIRVIIIKFADRLHNMRTIDSLAETKRERIALETRDVYAPLAHRLGMARIRWELEDLVLKTLDPPAYGELMSLIADRREERESYIETVSKPLRDRLRENDIESEIVGRPKHFFSIYNKMKRRNKPFSEIYDLLAIRILVKDKVDCYKALGVVHSTYTPVTERFKDYIAVPKINGYRSIHTTVIGPDGRMVEIQIRTMEMHDIAENGIAAHWLYKEGKFQMDQLDRQITWIRQLIDRQKDMSDANEILEDLKIDLFQDEVFVFTPKGDLITLAKGATPLDFAFAVHSEVGLRCIGGKVNGRIVPLHSELSSGDLVEVLTSDQQKPSLHWLEIVKTAKAKNYIKRHFRNVEMEQSIALGRQMLEQELKNNFLRKSIGELNEDLKKLAVELKFDSANMVLSSIGRGNLSAPSIAQKILTRISPKERDANQISFLKRLIRRPKTETKSLTISGIDNMMIHFARCCNPIPGDDILGYVTRGRGINVHRRDCHNIKDAVAREPERAIMARWDVDDAKNFLVQIRVVGYDRKNFLSDITQRISATDTNIVSAEVKTYGNEGVHTFAIEVRNIAHLELILDKIRKVPNVISATRVDHTGVGGTDKS